MEVSPYGNNHGSLINVLDGKKFEFDYVMPLFKNEAVITDKVYEIANTVSYFSKFDCLAYWFNEQSDFVSIDKYRRPQARLSNLLMPTMLRKRGFGKYIRNEFLESDDYFKTIGFVPDLWFETRFIEGANERGRVIGIVEIIKSNGINSNKWDAIWNLADRIDFYGADWFCVLKRYVDSQWYTCEYLA